MTAQHTPELDHTRVRRHVVTQYETIAWPGRGGLFYKMLAEIEIKEM